jgi:hypothetical protein
MACALVSESVSGLGGYDWPNRYDWVNDYGNSDKNWLILSLSGSIVSNQDASLGTDPSAFWSANRPSPRRLRPDDGGEGVRVSYSKAWLWQLALPFR